MRTRTWCHNSKGVQLVVVQSSWLVQILQRKPQQTGMGKVNWAQAEKKPMTLDTLKLHPAPEDKYTTAPGTGTE